MYTGSDTNFPMASDELTTAQHDPYHEMEKYLEKVAVSWICLHLFYKYIM